MHEENLCIKPTSLSGMDFDCYMKMQPSECTSEYDIMGLVINGSRDLTIRGKGRSLTEIVLVAAVVDAVVVVTETVIEMK